MTLLVSRDFQQALISINTPFRYSMRTQIVAGFAGIIQHLRMELTKPGKRFQDIHILTLRILPGRRFVMSCPVNTIPKNIGVRSLMAKRLWRMIHTVEEQLPVIRSRDHRC